MSASHILQVIKTHPAGFYKVYPDRIVNNIYFDTPNLICFNDNLSGISHRKKYRIRWYGEMNDVIKSPKLEVKYKENLLGGKTVFDVSDFSLGSLEKVIDEVNDKITQQYTLRPVLLNSYSRSYWETRCAKFRITVDSNMQFHSLMHSPEFFRYLHSDSAVVLELKYEEEDELDNERITNFLPFRLSKNSKYVNGILLTR